MASIGTRPALFLGLLFFLISCSTSPQRASRHEPANTIDALKLKEELTALETSLIALKAELAGAKAKLNQQAAILHHGARGTWPSIAQSLELREQLAALEDTVNGFKADLQSAQASQVSQFRGDIALALDERDLLELLVRDVRARHTSQSEPSNAILPLPQSIQTPLWNTPRSPLTTQPPEARATHTTPPTEENGTRYGDISSETGRPRTVPVRGYFRRDGTYVRGHFRSKPRQ
jgi:hypothetical protein